MYPIPQGTCLGQLKGKIDIRGKLVQWGGFKLTDKERKELNESEIGFCVNALSDPNVTREEISNAEVDSLLGKGLQAFAINYKQTGGGVNQSLTDLWDEVDKKSDKTELDALAATVDTKADKADIVDPEWGAITGNLTDQQDLKNALSDKAGIDYVTEVAAQKLDVSTFTTTVDELSSSLEDLNMEVLNSETIVDNLSSRVTTLHAQVLSKVSVQWYDDIEVSSSGWSATAPYTKSIEVEGIQSTHRLLVDLSTLNVDTALIEAKKEYYACVDQITPGTNTLTFMCSKEKPAGSFNIKVGVLT